MAEPVIVDLLRHGEVAAEGWAFRGRTDIPLSDTGWQQMRGVGRELADESFSQIATSPLQRCDCFSREFSKQLKVPVVQLEGMREMDFGAWENRGFAELEAEYAEMLHRFWQSPVGIQPPEGEAFDSFVVRVVESWDAWLEGSSGEHRLLVAHGGVIRVLLAYLLDMPMPAIWRLHLPYAAWSRVSLLQGQLPRVLFMNRLTA